MRGRNASWCVGQRAKLSAAFVVAVQNFSDDGDVLAFVIVAGLVGLIVLMATAAEVGRRQVPTG